MFKRYTKRNQSPTSPSIFSWDGVLDAEHKIFMHIMKHDNGGISLRLHSGYNGYMVIAHITKEDIKNFADLLLEFNYELNEEV